MDRNGMDRSWVSDVGNCVDTSLKQPVAETKTIYHCTIARSPDKELLRN